MSESTFHQWALTFQGASLFITLLGFVLILYRVGRYTGTNDQLIKQLFIYRDEDKKVFEEHVEEDREFQVKTTETLHRIELKAAHKSK